MIICFNVDFKDYDEKILNSYSFFDYVCPKCGAKHALTRHATYFRNLCFFDCGKFYEKKLCILRVKCSSCNSTHAILPNDVIPYCIYSFSCILNVLNEHFINGNSVLNVANTFGLSFQLIYIFISKFVAFFNSIFMVLRVLGFFAQSIPTTKDLIKAIINYSTTNNFMYQYFFQTRWLPFMTKFQNILPCPVYVGGFFEYFKLPT